MVSETKGPDSTTSVFGGSSVGALEGLAASFRRRKKWGAVSFLSSRARWSFTDSTCFYIKIRYALIYIYI